MKPRKWQRRGKRATGFSLTELVVAMAVALVLIGIGMPSFLKAYHAYQLSNAASQLSDILRLTRYDAIRHNVRITEFCVMKPDAADPTITDVFADANGDGNPSPLEKIVLLNNGGNVVDPGGVPGAAALLPAANITSVPIVATPGNFQVGFDSRGAVITSKVTIFYMASGLAADAGYRAVLLMPAGSIQVWTGDGAGNWSQLR